MRLEVHQHASLDEAKAEALRAIDEAAGETRRRFITEVPGQQATYLVKYEQARAYAAAGYPPDTSAYPYIEAEMAAQGLPAEGAANLILATGAPWNDILGPAIEARRLAGKRQVREATTRTGVRAARDAALDALSTVGNSPSD